MQKMSLLVSVRNELCKTGVVIRIVLEQKLPGLLVEPEHALLPWERRWEKDVAVFSTPELCKSRRVAGRIQADL